MPVNVPIPQYEHAIKAAMITRDACQGEEHVKHRGREYLPQPSVMDDEEYARYKTRAYYTNFTGRTKDGMIGAVFRKDMAKKELGQVEYLVDNADGAGAGIEQLAKRGISELLEGGNYGFLVDYPQVADNPSLEQTMGVSASILPYKVESIISYDTKEINGKDVLSLVVLKEESKVYSDRFTWTYESEYRALFLDDDNIYNQVLYSEGGAVLEEYLPKQNGKPMRHIPFYWAGSVDNKPGYDKPALLDLAIVNLAHYRNTADHEQELFLCGQKMAHINIGDMSTDQWTTANPDGIVIGSARAIVTQNGSADLLEPQSGGALKEAIADKEAQAVSIGAKLINGNTVNQTAETARINASSETSVLNTIVGNISEALTMACKDCARFMGVSDEGIEIELNREFFEFTFDYKDAQMMVLLKDSNLMTSDQALNTLRKAGLIDTDMDNQDLLNEMEKEPSGMVDVD